MNTLALLSLICVYQCAPVLMDDSAETTTTTDTTTASGETTAATGPVDFDAFDADLDDVYKSIAKIKSKASKLELIGPKIQSAMLHLAGDEQDIAKNLQAKYAQILPLLQKIKTDDSSATQKAAAANRRRRDATTDSGVTESTNTETTSSDFTTESSTASSSDVTNVNATSASPASSPAA